jgi:hypothetical protein
MNDDPQRAFRIPLRLLPDVEPIECELANGHAVKIEARLWQRVANIEDWAAGILPEPYFAIRLYCTEGTLPRRLAWLDEFRNEADFALVDFPGIWEAIEQLTSSRQFYDFDSFWEFAEHLGDLMQQYLSIEVDAVEHYADLPLLTAPQWFDRYDDSVYNDQNDPKAENCFPTITCPIMKGIENDRTHHHLSELQDGDQADRIAGGPVDRIDPSRV